MATMAKSARRIELEEHVQDVHDMESTGQAWSWEACGVRCPEACTICGLTHVAYRNGQNSPDADVYATASGEPLTLAQAARLECE